METSDPKYKHKPSEKHTLEEVLKSLQDLIRNDLTEGAAGAAKPGSAAAAASEQHEGAPSGAAGAKPRRDNASGLREDFAPVTPGSGPVNLDAVMRSLKDLIGNELDVGDVPPPAPAETAPASTHAEYLATEEKIEEYIPEQLGRLDDVPFPGDESTTPESVSATPPPTDSLAPDEIIEETLPQGFTPLDEELTLEELAETTPPQAEASEEIIEETLPQGFTPLDEELTLEDLAQAAPPPPALSATPDLPGEISPELLVEPELAPPPSTPEAPLAMNDSAVRGTQQELFLEEPPPIELRMPPPDTRSTPASEAAPAPEPPAAPAVGAPVAELNKGNTEQALPTIDVEESFDTGNYFDAAQPPAENTPPVSEELITLDVEFSGTPETSPATVETSPATPTDASPAPEPPAAPVEKKIILEIVSGPLLDNPHDRSEVDFDTLGLEPSPPEPTPVAAETPAPEAELPVIVVEPDLSPVVEPENPKAPEEPATEIKADTAPAAEPPAAPAEPGSTDQPPSVTLDDIPVLNEVVAPPAGSVPIPATPPAPPLPAPDRARDLVVRAVAKLNVEMRKTGGTGLDTKTILRLQQLIRQELEKDREK
ncbi:MAG TPA: hypothetical protein VLG93_08015 [Sulfuricaulis sp.]|nr:hypothetical protein [Sulfuricaulis sp.]